MYLGRWGVTKWLLATLTRGLLYLCRKLRRVGVLCAAWRAAVTEVRVRQRLGALVSVPAIVLAQRLVGVRHCIVSVPGVGVTVCRAPVLVRVPCAHDSAHGGVHSRVLTGDAKLVLLRYSAAF